MADLNTYDTLSSTLLNLKLKSGATGAVDGRGSYAIEVSAFEGFKLYQCLRGEMYFFVQGVKKPCRLQLGDCILLTGRAFTFSTDVVPKNKIKLEDMMKTAKNGIAVINGGGERLSSGTHFLFEGHLPKIIFAHLPPAIQMPEHLDQSAALRWSIERFRAEFIGRALGRTLIINHLAPIILMQILRIYLQTETAERNWLTALTDPKLSRAIDAIHSGYGKAWSLEKLATTAGMSRSRFAAHFKEQVGIPPMDYLMNWRMQMACELLKAGDQTVSTVANAVGYESESAFSVAFKKVVSVRPGVYLKNV